MNLSQEIQKLLKEEVTERFLKYVKIWTTSDENSQKNPSSKNQFELGKILLKELKKLKLKDVIHDKYGYVYASLPASKGCEKIPLIGFISHLDTSPAVSGKDIKPVIHKNYDGSVIMFAKNDDLMLSIKDSPQLKDYIGADIITSQGDTLLGADDKAGIAEITTACTIWKKYPEITHGNIVICFTPDEEIGRGTQKIKKKKLPQFCYTIDGSEMGQLELECFDAWSVKIKFVGLNVHPGYAKNLMINAIHIASRFFSELPKEEAPEKTENREGFYHLDYLSGTEEEAKANLIVRDFDIKNNQKRLTFLNNLKEKYEKEYPGLRIEMISAHQYENMLTFLEKEKKIVDFAKKAIEQAGLEVKMHSIRGGTDGARLCAIGIKTPNLFAGGLLFHSRKEYIPTIALQKGTEVILYLSNLWTKGW